MRIFKKEFKDELTEGMSIGECIITKVDDSRYGQFIVHKKVKEGAFPYLGLFRLLEDAVNFVQTIEGLEQKYEYYSQFESINSEGWNRDQREVMGQLGWELCGIDSNIKDEHGKSMYIYKRLLPLKESNTKKDYQWFNSMEMDMRRSEIKNQADLLNLIKDFLWK